MIFNNNINYSAIVGTCSCSIGDGLEDENGECISVSSSFSVKEATITLTSITGIIGFLIAVVNKKLILSYRFLDTA